jgi:glucose-1-phosphate cytidylyltransferase
MKVVILAGGFGTRISEESASKPKPMIEIGGKPILWHIMKIYSSYGFNEFVICLGYKGYVIKEYFAHYLLHQSDVTFDFTSNSQQIIHNQHAEPWKVTLVDTGENTMTGGRVRKIKKYIKNEPFLLTYGDGVCDVNIKKLVSFHKENKCVVTITAIQPAGRFGVLNLEKDDKITGFEEKPKGDGAWINGGFMVAEPDLIEIIKNDASVLEQGPLKQLAKEGRLISYKHNGFWYAMDTLRDRQHLESLWNSNKAPWKNWQD